MKTTVFHRPGGTLVFAKTQFSALNSAELKHQISALPSQLVKSAAAAGP